MPRTITATSPYRVSRIHELSKRDLGFGLLSAVLYILSFPNFNLSFLAWVALVPLAAASAQLTPKRSFLLGWLSGTLAYAGILSWVVVTFLAARQSIVLAVPSLVLLAAYLGLFWGAWTWFIAITSRKLYPGNTPPAFSIVSTAAAWVALEYIRTHLFTGFPWTLLADTQWRHLYLIQVASITGVYGVSFLIALVNAANANALRRSGWAPAWAAVGVLGCILFGANRLRAYAHEPRQPAYKVALLQGSIDQYQKWDKRYTESIQRTYEELTSLVKVEKPALIVWPETSVPGYLLQDPPLHDWLTHVVARSGTYHIVGAPSLLENKSAYNSAFSLDPKGQIIGQYDKQHLVPFGEVVPLSGLLGRWIQVLNDLGGFTAGSRSPVQPTGIGPAGINICYEAIFPNLVRQSVRQGATFIVNLTNDGWYLRTAAPYQHFIPNVFRAVENDRWVLRADNTGVSAIIDPTGQVQVHTSIFVPTAITGMATPRHTMTFYTLYGDVFAWLCLGFCILLGARAILRRL